MAARLAPAGRALGGALAAALALAAPAAADNIVYSGSDGNLWTTTTDGSVKKQLTADGTAELPYRGPTQTNDGRVLTWRGQFFSVRGLDGSLKAAWQAPTGGSFYKTPLAAQVAPDGGFVTWSYIHSAHVSEPPFQRVSFQTPDGGTPAPCTINCHSGFSDPRWIPNTPYAGMISTSRTEIRVQQGGSAAPVAWASTTDEFEGFDVSRTGNRILIVTTPDGTPAQGQHQAGQLEVFQGTAAPPAGGSVVCAAPLGDETSQPRWAPDGSAFTWSDAAGVWTSPAPVAGPGGVCTIAPKLIAAGGSSPDWGPAAGPTKPADPGNPGNPGNPGIPGDPGNPGNPGDPQNPPADTVAPELTGLAGAKTKLATALSKGYAVSFKTTEAGTAKVELFVSGTTARGLRIVVAKTVRVAAGSRNVAAPGKHSVVAKFTKKAKAKFKRLRSVKVSARITFTDAAKNADVATKSLTLKR